jgi:class 3 adenylate cyclase
MAKKDCVILFADLADSVSLYDRVGDEAAKNHVLDLQRQLREQLEAFDGKIHEIIGDEIMVCFDAPDRALACSIALHNNAKQFSQQQSIELKLRIGMHFGQIIEDEKEGRLFGDTINLASRVTGIAQADQTILTNSLFQKVSTTWRDSVRQFDVTMVKGKTEPLIVYDLPWQHDDLTAIMSTDTLGDPGNHAQQLILKHQDEVINLSDHQGVFSIGRAITNNLVVNADPVSRRHVTIERARDYFVLNDKSTNGTHLFTSSGETFYLRRQQWPMSGSGEFALGATREQGDDHIVRFECGLLTGAS